MNAESPNRLNSINQPILHNIPLSCVLKQRHFVPPSTFEIVSLFKANLFSPLTEAGWRRLISGTIAVPRIAMTNLRFDQIKTHWEREKKTLYRKTETDASSRSRNYMETTNTSLNYNNHVIRTSEKNNNKNKQKTYGIISTQLQIILLIPSRWRDVTRPD